MTAEGNDASDGLREALREELEKHSRTDSYYWADETAVALIALRELATLRAKAAAADRVRAIANEDTWGEVDPLDHRDRIRRALDGDRGRC